MKKEMTSWFKPKIGFLSFLALGLFATSCRSEEQVRPAEDAVGVEIRTAEMSSSATAQNFPGSVESKEQANLSTIVMGTVTTVPVNVGDNVEKGDVLVRIKDDQILAQKEQLEANRIQAEANLLNTEKNYNRIKNLYEEKSATSKELDDISTMYEIAKANLEALDARLNETNEMLQYTVIRAPFNGVVSSKFVSAGDMATPGHPLLTISNPGSIKITANIPETWIGKVAEGDTIQVSVAAADVRNVPATLYSVSEAGDPASRQFAVEAEITDPAATQHLRPGMFAQVSMNLDERNTLFIPQSAIVQRGQLTGVYTLSDDNKAILRWVRTGQVSGDYVEILTGLAAGEQYVVNTDQPIRQGQLLTVR